MNFGALKYEFGNDSGNTLYLNPENVFITEESEVQNIYYDIQGFEFYSYETSNCPIDYDIKVGDIITFTDGENEYPTIAQYDLEYFGGWIGGYNLKVNTERQEETKIIGEKEKIRDLKVIVDRQNNTITQVVSEVDEQNTKISQTQQTVNELNSKISDIADITTQAESIYASLNFTNINQSEPIEVKIHPTTTNISYLYPRDNLYPSDTLYMTNRILRFTNTETDEVFDYELPDDLLINLNTGTYDEFYLGYDEQICQVTKRCTYNADGSVSDLATETTTQYTYPSILLTDGDYTVELLGYNNGYMSVRLMAQNIYTTQFATKAELNSEISQTATQIQTIVSATYETKQNAQTNYSQITQTANGIQTQVNQNGQNISTLQQTANSLSSTVSTKVGKNEVISTINQSAEAITINANKIGLTANNVLDIISGSSINLTSKNITISSNEFNVDKNGNITATGGTIGGWTIGTNRLYSGSGSSYVRLDSNANVNSAIWCGNEDADSAPFRVSKAGVLRATNANISGTITATSGTFQNCTITNSCSVPASTVSGTLATSTIPNLNASKITSGTISADRLNGVNAVFGTLGATADFWSGGQVSSYLGYESQGSMGVGEIGNPVYLIVQHEGQYWRRLTFKGGILVNIESSW